MATKRKTGKDYSKELQDLNEKKRSLEAKVDTRLLELSTTYPEIDLPTSRAGGLKTKNIAHIWIIQETKIEAKIEYLQVIEQYLADKHPHKQTKIVFPEKPICPEIYSCKVTPHNCACNMKDNYKC